MTGNSSELDQVVKKLSEIEDRQVFISIGGKQCPLHMIHGQELFFEHEGFYIIVKIQEPPR